MESESRSVMSNSLQPHGTVVHGILQARTLEWVTLPFSRGSSQPRDRSQVSHIAVRFFTSWAMFHKLKVFHFDEFQTVSSSYYRCAFTGESKNSLPNPEFWRLFPVFLSHRFHSSLQSLSMWNHMQETNWVFVWVGFWALPWHHLLKTLSFLH